MKTIRMNAGAVVGASVLMSLIAVNSPADQTSPASVVKTYTGTVSAVIPIARTVKVKGGLFSNNFNLGDNCTYNLWEKNQGTISDLRPGERVTVRYQDASGVLVADNVKQDPMTEQGMVKAINPAAHTMVVHSSWTDYTFVMPDDCQVLLRDDKSGLLTDIQPGNQVTVTYEKPDGKSTAKEIAQISLMYAGDLTAIDLDQKTIRAKTSFSSKDFVLGNNCAVVIGNRTDGKLTDLRPGESIFVSYDDVNGVNIVNRIAPAGAVQTTQTAAAR